MIHVLAGLVFLGAAIKLSRGSESFGLGTIPPMPSDPGDFELWVERTYQIGTPVRVKNTFRKDKWCWDRSNPSADLEDPDEYDNAVIPAGTLMSVLDTDGWEFTLEFDEIQPLFTGSIKSYCQIKVHLSDMPKLFEPLVDNWGSLTVSQSRSYKAGWTPKPTRYKGRP